MKTKLSRFPSYLVRNPYTYCFRMNVPQDLQPYIGRKELRYSSQTGYLSRPDKKQDTFNIEELEKLFCLSPEYGQDTFEHAHH